MNTGSPTADEPAPGSTPHPAAPDSTALDSTAPDYHRTISLWAGLGLVLLLPMVGGSYILSLLGEQAGRCLTYGEGCSTLPDGVLHALFWSAVALGLTAAALPRTRWISVRYGAVILQWGAQTVLCLLIVGGV
ncbi:hypothetical protein [Streptomyces ossamyceticus]|jgi:hypothetical protein|uniref:hypothetical protein n=1 Tax=Streptomyces ossamyceticus TaxID=249581 RepID=UPI003EBA6010